MFLNWYARYSLPDSCRLDWCGHALGLGPDRAWRQLDGSE